MEIQQNGFRFFLLLLLGSFYLQAADDYGEVVQPLLVKHCTKCHGDNGKVKGKVNLAEISTGKEFLARPNLIKEMLEVIDGGDMPPEEESPLLEGERNHLLASLRTLLVESTRNSKTPAIKMRRLNRFQYNNTVKDLFKLSKNVFPLPEKLMTRHGNYLLTAKGKMPERVNVNSETLNPKAGLAEVRAFPKDLRASHGFDNQANQLTLSPLLLDAFLKLSVSIVESPDFNSNNVGIWDRFFKEPAEGSDLPEEVRKRLTSFMTSAFRRPVDDKALQRYTNYTIGKIGQGVPFSEAMKKAASAILSSP